VRAIGERLAGAGHRAWLVGGCVRDALRGRAPRDWDILTSAGESDLERLFPRVRRVNERFVTVLVGVAPGAPVRQVSLLEGRTLEADLARRDFTVNAMAAPLPGARGLVDPQGGHADLEARVLRAVLDPDARFTDDPLRPLRAVRFEVELDLAPEPATLAAMNRHGPGVRTAAVERIREEILRTLAAPAPSRAIERMRETGMLGVLLPEVAAMSGVTQNRHHRLDVYDHSLAALDFMAEDPASDPVLRLATLLHDAGKPVTRTVRKGEPSFIGHEQVGARMAEARARALRLPEAESARVRDLVLHHLVRYTPRWSDRAVRRFVRRVSTARLEDLLRLCAADTRAKDPAACRDVPVPPEVAALRERIDRLSAQGMAVRIRDLAITGEDVIQALGVAPGPEVGRLLEALLERVIADPSLNRRDRLLEEARAMGDRSRMKT